jgi:iron complex transport system ATP-binding protein
VGVSAELGGHRILHDIGLEVRAGEVVVLVGPNGAGKTTLFGVLSGDIPHSGGEIRLDGELIRRWSRVEMAMRRAVLPQEVVMNFPFVVFDVVRMGRAPWFATSREEEDDAVVAAVLAEADVSGLALRQFSTLSGGERARVAFARVLAQKSQLLLLDEPTAAMDIRHQELVLRVIKSRAKAGAGVVVVLHDLALAAAFADRIVVLRRGRLVADGPPEEVLRSELLSDVYEHHIEVISSPIDGLPLALPIHHRALTL